MLYRENVHAGRAGYKAPGSTSLTQVHTNVHCCHWLSKELSNKGYQTYQRVEHPKNQYVIKLCYFNISKDIFQSH